MDNGENGIEPDAGGGKLAAAQAALGPFLAQNPLSELVLDTSGDDPMVILRKPWGDSSVSFTIPDDDGDLFDALNNVYLPERLSAIWHVDYKSLEVIWTSYRLPDFQEEIDGRKFKFIHDGKSYDCEFRVSSKRLVKIGSRSNSLATTETQFRNLASFQLLYFADEQEDVKEAKEFFSLREPISFWISEVDWKEDEVLDMINHLNFHLTYFDTLSPHVVIHSTPIGAKFKPQTRYISGKFPEEIRARSLDDNLMTLCQAAKAGNEAHRFLYYFRAIEYASFSYLDIATRVAVRRLLLAPDAAEDSVLNDAWKIVTRVTGNEARSLGLHPAIYFYNERGRHSRFLFLAIMMLVSTKVRNNDDQFFKRFTRGRAALEKFLVENKSLISLLLQNMSKAQRVTNTQALFEFLISEFSEGRTVSPEEAISQLGLRGNIINIEAATGATHFSDDVKSEAFMSRALASALKCSTCEGYLDAAKSVSYDHKEPRRDGGKGDVSNADLVHPYCNTGYKN